jgi:hypothetical protein
VTSTRLDELSDGFRAFLSALAEPRFYTGISKKAGAKRGAFVVKLWWIAWQTWSVDGRFFGTKNGTRFGTIFLPGLVR